MIPNTSPFFSDKDKELLSNETNRDYLGVLPIWSSVARALVPHISNPVTQVKGIIAVLFIHAFYQHISKDSKNEINFRQYFRLMEGLCEIYFHLNLKNAIYGTRAINSASKDLSTFTIDRNDARTIATSLYQYYRGSCRRAGLLDNDWGLADKLNTILTDIIVKHPDASNHLKMEITAIIQADSKTTSLKPEPLLRTNNNIISNFLKDIFSSTGLKTALSEMLFQDTDLRYFSKVCHETREINRNLENTTNTSPDPNPTTKFNFVEKVKHHIQNEKPGWPYFQYLENIIQCEPFLICLAESYQLIQLNNGENIKRVTRDLADELVSISNKAKSFLRLKPYFDTSRFKDIYNIAEYAADNNFDEYFKSIVTYQKNLLKNRNREAMLILENDKIQVIAEFDPIDLNKIKKELRYPNPWQHDYYFTSNAKIYQQLFVGNNAQ